MPAASTLGTVLVSDFDYDLPEELIAQQPSAVRGSSRMLVISRAEQRFQDDVFTNFPAYVQPGDCLVLNDTKVFPARLHGHRSSRGRAAVEVFLVRPLDEAAGRWLTLVKPAKRVRAGDRILLTTDGSEEWTAQVLAAGDYGERTIVFDHPARVEQLIERFGAMPLPPYIRREAGEQDRTRYQTVFARAPGSVAAPTAGLHFTPAILQQVRAAGAEVATVTLHVGLGTFAPLRANDVSQIELHSESFAIDEHAAAAMRRARRLLCVGTTSVRAIETALLAGEPLRATQGETNLFIYPGFRFRGAAAMLTNFHLPQSSLLLLVSAFGGRELILAAYRHAVEERYRFYSYGDCMLIL